MEEPSSYEKAHWQMVTAGGRMFGCTLCVVFIVFILTLCMNWIGGGQWYDLSTGGHIWAIAACIPGFFLGVAFLKVKPYYPSKYREYYDKKTNK